LKKKKRFVAASKTNRWEYERERKRSELKKKNCKNEGKY